MCFSWVVDIGLWAAVDGGCRDGVWDERMLMIVMGDDKQW